MCGTLVVLTWKKIGLEYASGAREKVFELTPSRTSENALLASEENIAFIIDLYREEYISSSESFLNWVVQYI